MKLDPASIDIGPLQSIHDRDAFISGNAALDTYFRTQASQDSRRDLARVFVATPVDDPSRVIGFYTLSAATVRPTDLPSATARKLPRHSIPAALIGRLAVDGGWTGRGLGRILVADAVRKTVAASRTVAMAFLVVDPIDDAARTFCRSLGFVSLVSTDDRMFLALATAAIPS